MTLPSIVSTVLERELKPSAPNGCADVKPAIAPNRSTEKQERIAPIALEMRGLLISASCKSMSDVLNDCAARGIMETWPTAIQSAIADAVRANRWTMADYVGAVDAVRTVRCGGYLDDAHALAVVAFVAALKKGALSVVLGIEPIEQRGAALFHSTSEIAGLSEDDARVAMRGYSDAVRSAIKETGKNCRWDAADYVDCVIALERIRLGGYRNESHALAVIAYVAHCIQRWLPR